MRVTTRNSRELVSMSNESMTTLRTKTVQGFGIKPWHYSEGVSAPPYPDAVPEDVVAGMFPNIVEVPNGYRLPPAIAADGVTEGEWIVDSDRKALLRDDTNALLAVVGNDYAVHQYGPTLLAMGLPTACAGILRGGRNAWVQYGTADEVTTADNVRFSTKLLCVTSADASLATQMRYVTTLAVCDNTLSAALREGGGTLQRVRHTRLSVPRVEGMRRAFRLIDQVAEQAIAAITEQVRTTVTDAQVSALLDKLLPNSVPGVTSSSRARSMADRNRAAIQTRYRGMWSPYTGTEFGILQAVDTTRRWDIRKSGDIQEAQMRKVVSGAFDRKMSDTQRMLQGVRSQ